MRFASWPLLFVALLGTFAASDARAQAEREAGVTAASNPAVDGVPPVTARRQLSVGVTVFERERVISAPDGQASLLFRDGSSFTVGPNSDLVLDEFAYDPQAGKGHAALSLGKGVFRFVGGKLSKDGSVSLTTPSAVLGVRGGIVLVDVQAGGATTATLLYGNELSVRANTGEIVNLLRPGFSVTVPGIGMPPGEPVRLPPDRLRASFDMLQGQPGRPGGLPRVPPPPMVVAGLTSPVVMPGSNQPAPPPPQGGQSQGGQTQAGQTQGGSTSSGQAPQQQAAPPPTGSQGGPQGGTGQPGPGPAGGAMTSPFASGAGAGPGGTSPFGGPTRMAGPGPAPTTGPVMGPGAGPPGVGPGAGPPGMGPPGPAPHGPPQGAQGRQRQILAPPGQ